MSKAEKAAKVLTLVKKSYARGDFDHTTGCPFKERSVPDDECSCECYEAWLVVTTITFWESLR